MNFLRNQRRRFEPTLRDFLEPTVAAVFFVLWCVAEAGRWVHSGVLLPLALYSLAIALSRRVPAAALALILAVPILQLLYVMPGPGSTDWPIILAGFIVTFFVSLRATGVLRWVTLAVGAVYGAGLGFLLLYVGDWMSWVGLGVTSAAGSDFAYEIDPETGQVLSVTAPMNEANYPNYLSLSAPDSSIAAFTENYGDFQLSGARAQIDMAALQLETALKFSAMGLAMAIAAWALGVALQFALRRQRDRQARLAITADLAASDANLALLQERSRIAQEVHDVVAHSLALTLSLAEGSKMLRESKGESHDDLQKIADTSRSALVELQSLLEGIEGENSTPQPRLEDLGKLVSKVAPTGLDVDLKILGEPKPLTAVQELSVYRIVQESLTNALKHGGKKAHAAISLDWRGVGLSLNIVSAGVPGRDHDHDAEDSPAESKRCPEPRSGLGLSGMRERARLAGGWLTAGIEPDEDNARGLRTYVVTAFIPTQDIHAEVPV